MKIPELTTEKVAAFLRIDLPDESDDLYGVMIEEIQMCMDSVLAFMCNRTGHTEEYIKDQPDLTQVFLAFCGEEYENRQYRLSTGQYKNEYIMDKLMAHSINLLPGEADMVNGEGD